MRRPRFGGPVAAIALAAAISACVEEGLAERLCIPCATQDDCFPGLCNEVAGFCGIDGIERCVRADAGEVADAADAEPEDAPADAAPDAGRDAGPDADLDAGLDAGRDGGLDAGRDGGLDAGRDGGLDAGRDAAVDAGDAAPECGNRVVEGTEECDDGDRIEHNACHACRRTCGLVRGFALGPTAAGAVTFDRRAFVWGEGPDGELGLGPNLTKASDPVRHDLSGADRISFGERHLVLQVAASVRGAGSNVDLQLGLAETTTATSRLATIFGAPGGVSGAVAGARATYVINAARLHAAGSNLGFEQGVESGDQYPFHEVLFDGASADVGAVAASGSLVAALHADGSVWVFGSSAEWALDKIPTRLDLGGRRATAIAVGEGHVLALVEGAVVGVGENDVGQLGLGVPGAPVSVPTTVPGLARAQAVFAVGRSSYVVRFDGSLVAFGDNRDEALGIPGAAVVSLPTVVPTAPQGPIAAIVGRGTSRMMLMASGDAYMFGASPPGDLFFAGRPVIGKPAPFDAQRFCR